MRNFYPQLFFNGPFYFVDACVIKLFYFARLDTNKMVMFIKLERFFELGAIAAKVVFDQQFAIEQQLDGVVERCPAHAVFIVFHVDIERLYIKVTLGVVYLFQDSKPFRGFAVLFAFEVINKYFFNGFERVFLFLQFVKHFNKGYEWLFSQNKNKRRTKIGFFLNQANFFGKKEKIRQGSSG